MGLPDSVCTVCRLVLHGKIPPWVIMNHNISSDQIKPSTSGFQGNQKDGYVLSAVELADQSNSLLLGSRAGNSIKGNLCLLQILCQKREHGSKLGKNQHAMPPVYGVLNQFQTGCPLGAGALIIFKEEGGITAKLAKTGDFGKNPHFVFTGVSGRGENFLHVHHMSII